MIHILLTTSKYKGVYCKTRHERNFSLHILYLYSKMIISCVFNYKTDPTNIFILHAWCYYWQKKKWPLLQWSYSCGTTFTINPTKKKTNLCINCKECTNTHITSSVLTRPSEIGSLPLRLLLSNILNHKTWVKFF